MAQKKIISIEDRIPKLKETKKKKANRKLILYLTIFFLLILVIIYLQSPFSNVRDVQVLNHKFVTQDEILQLSGISSEENFWKVNLADIEEKISSHPLIKQADVKRDFYNTITIFIEEFYRVGYVKEEYMYYPILENGQAIKEQMLHTPGSDAPILIGWENPVYLSEMTRELRKLPEALALQISEIHWVPQDENPYKIRLYMVNGQEVIASIRNFSEKMKLYPSIASKLSSDQQGIIHIDVGAYFEPYDHGKSSEYETESDNREQQ
ncbi:MAG: FtsQ-type POTRA domain-containing protein [Bacillaceae bacterium]|nr:FtsQ-type POTRA domain-containing protein [Bacillaceae bacterium]